MNSENTQLNSKSLIIRIVLQKNYSGLSKSNMGNNSIYDYK